MNRIIARQREVYEHPALACAQAEKEAAERERRLEVE